LGNSGWTRRGDGEADLTGGSARSLLEQRCASAGIGSGSFIETGGGFETCSRG
jgi:hypothetical protein